MRVEGSLKCLGKIWRANFVDLYFDIDQKVELVQPDIHKVDSHKSTYSNK